VATGAGNVYSAGFFSGTIQFGMFSVKSDATNAGNWNDAFVVARGETKGDVAWVKVFGGPDSDAAYGEAFCSDLLFVVGEFSGAVTFGSTTLTSEGGRDAFVMALRGSDGVVQWVAQGGGTGEDMGRGVACYGDKVYVIGDFSGTFSVTSRGVVKQVISKGGTDVFVAAFSSGGVLRWLRGVGGTGSDSGSRVSISVIDGNAFLSGNFIETATIGTKTVSTTAGSKCGFVASLSESDGSTVWATQVTLILLMRCFRYDFAVVQAPAAPSVMNDVKFSIYDGGVLFVTGMYEGTGTWGTTTLPATDSSQGNQDMFVGAIDPATGTKLWAQVGGGSCTDTGAAVDYTAGQLIVAGHYCGFSNSLDGFTFPEANSDDVFITSMSVVNGKVNWVSTLNAMEEQQSTSLTTSSNCTYLGISNTFGGTVPISMSEPAAGDYIFVEKVSVSEAAAMTVAYNTGCAFGSCGPKVVASSESNVTISWNLGDYTMTKYEVQYQSQSATWITAGETTARTYIVTGLQAFRSYHFKVRGFRTKQSSWSAFTPFTMAMTKAGLPSAPGIPVASQILQRVFTISFQPSGSTGTSITSYRYNLAKQNGAFGSPVDTGSTQTTITITGLARYTNYRIQVQAQNARGWGALSPIASIRTLPDLPAAPASLSIGEITKNSAVLVWVAAPMNPAYGGGPLLEIVVYRQKQRRGTWQVFITVPAQQSLTLTLQSGTSYTFCVAVKNDAGISARSPAAPPFTTIADSTAPTLSKYLPPSDSIQNPLNVDVLLTFSEPVVVSGPSGAITFLPISGEAHPISVSLNNRTYVSQSAGNTIKIQIPGGLTAGVTYQVEASQNLVHDLASPPNFCQDMIISTWKFSTVGATLPTPTKVVPAPRSLDPDESTDFVVYSTIVGCFVCLFLVVFCLYQKRLCAKQVPEPPPGKITVVAEMASMFSPTPPVAFALPSSLETLYLECKVTLRLTKIDTVYCDGRPLKSYADMEAAVSQAEKQQTRILHVKVQGTKPYCCFGRHVEGRDQQIQMVRLNLGNSSVGPDSPGIGESYSYSESGSSRSDEHLFRKSLDSHFMKIKEDIGLEDDCTTDKAELEAISHEAIQISKDAIAKAKSFRNAPDVASTSRPPEKAPASSQGRPKQTVEPLTERPSEPEADKGKSAKDRLRQSLALRKKAQQDKKETAASPAAGTAGETSEHTDIGGNDAAKERSRKLKQQLAARVKARGATKPKV